MILDNNCDLQFISFVEFKTGWNLEMWMITIQFWIVCCFIVTLVLNTQGALRHPRGPWGIYEASNGLLGHFGAFEAKWRNAKGLSLMAFIFNSLKNARLLNYNNWYRTNSFKFILDRNSWKFRNWLLRQLPKANHFAPYNSLEVELGTSALAATL